MDHYSRLYTHHNNQTLGYEMRCKDHPEWSADTDYTVLDTLTDRMDEHIKEAHEKAGASC